ncbi:MAG: biopolymer transporter ExbD [Pyrinomonadaceae bacterium MAG19_C2-C3]|nr:biopolymer transporter ExbD [Pyrinomonadaceae bacterium MAG19_C2-C3]
MKTIKANLANVMRAGLALIIGGASICAQQATSPATVPPSPVAQSANDGRVPLSAVALTTTTDAQVRLAATLRDTNLAGASDAPARGIRFIVENQGQSFITFVAGRVSFYDTAGVRCGSGLFTVSAFAAGERAETDAPGLRLTCAPVMWRIAVTQLVSNASTATNNATDTATNTATQTSAGINATVNVAPVIVFISRDGKFYVGGIEVTKAELNARLATLLSAKPAGERIVRIDADAETNYGLVLEVADAARMGGASQIQFGEQPNN